ncbi:MAG: alpha/beta fold hydrolase [Candidatus Thorarchaeota archaeon]|nr:alpha/beta fold hydrolase [Candidatus Thorarchaeota archaeon]
MPELAVNDVRLHYRIVGEGPPLLLIHGLGSDLRGWEFQEGTLSKHFQLILVDQRGHGRSSGPGMDAVLVPIFAQDMIALLDHLGISKVHVAGQSMGGLIAQQLALDYPERVDRLVLISTGFKITEETVDEVFSWREAQVEGGDEAYFRTATNSCYPEEFIENNKELMDYLFNKENLLNPDGVMAAGLGLAMFDATERLKEMKFPTLIVHGDLDKVFNISLAKTAAELIPNSELAVYPGCGHSSAVQIKDELNAKMIEFLKET